MMIFPLLKFWAYSPLGFVAAVIWNLTEVFGIRNPFAPQIFGLILGGKSNRVTKPSKAKGE